MTSLCLLEYAYTACTLLASGISISSLYLYTYYAAHKTIKLNPLASCIPVAAVLAGISVYSSVWCSIPLLLILGWCLYYKPQYRIFIFHALACICSVFCMLIIDELRYTTKQHLLATKTHTIQGLIVDHAEWLNHTQGCIITLAITHIDYQPSSGTLTFFLYSQAPIQVGDHVCCFRFNLPAATKQKNILRYYALREHNLGAYYGPFISAKILDLKTILSEWMTWWYRWRKKLYEKLQTILPQKTFAYFSSLFLGNKDCDDYLTMRIHFTRWGLTHYLARSGLHISILMSLWLSALICLPLGQSFKALILASVLILYDQLSWQSISFNRALWLWLLYIGGWLTQFNATPLVGLCNVMLIILLHNPWYALCLDFQLSFFLTIVLMLLSYHRERSFLLSSCIIKKK